MIRPGRAAILWLLAPLAAVAVLSLVRPHFLAAAERATYDALARQDRAHHTDGRVVIVDIDERSLSAVGQWPWRREVLGALVNRIRSSGPPPARWTSSWPNASARAQTARRPTTHWSTSCVADASPLVMP
jgi:hypothetical protein